MDRIKKSLLVLFILTTVFIFSSCAKKYTINFVIDDDVISTTIVKRGDKISIPTDPLKEGYTFIEWQLNNERYNFSTAVKEDKELKAKFEINKYNVVFDSNGGSFVEPTELINFDVEEGTILSLSTP